MQRKVEFRINEDKTKAMMKAKKERLLGRILLLVKTVVKMLTILHTQRDKILR